MPKRRITLVSIAGLAFALFVVWPTVNALRVRSAVATALREADSVRLEEFAFNLPLASVELPRAGWAQIISAMPMAPDIGVPGSVKMCFIPHHRVIITDRHRQQFKFTVCFE